MKCALKRNRNQINSTQIKSNVGFRGKGKTGVPGEKLCALKVVHSPQGAFFWGYSSYSYSGLGIAEYTEFQFRKSNAPRSGNGIPMVGGELRTTMSAHVHVLGCERPRRISRQKFPLKSVFCLFRVNRIPSILFILLSGAE